MINYIFFDIFIYLFLHSQRELFTANNVTLARTLLVVPILWSLKFGHVWFAFLLVLFHDYLDHLDGIVARAQKEMGHKDDPLLGGFLDAFCDKIVINTGLIGVLMVSQFGPASWWSTLLYLAVVAGIMGYEVALAVVRVEDYYTARFQPDSSREIKASMEGKLKEKLESLGLGGLCLASSAAAGPMSTISGWVGIICFALSIRFAHASIAHKIKAWTKKTE